MELIDRCTKIAMQAPTGLKVNIKRAIRTLMDKEVCVCVKGH